MLKRDLLLGSLGVAPYTHLVTVGYDSRATLGFDDLSISNPIGSITPKFFQGIYDSMEIHELSYTTTQYLIRFNVNGFLADYARLYLGRSDIRKNFGHPTSGSEEGGNAFFEVGVYDDLFTDEDVGKEIPIWLSYTPPVALTHCSSSNSSSYGRVA